MLPGFNKAKNIVNSIYHDADVQMKAIPKICTKGCAYCCCQIPTIHETEETLISDYIENRISAGDKDYCREKVNQWLDYFMAHTPDKALTTPDIIELEKLVSRERIPCPFLKDSLCLIYKVRPIACRAFSVNDNKKLCEQKPNRNCDQKVYDIRSYLISRLKLETGFVGFRPLTYAVLEPLGIKRELRTLARPRLF